ncbi:MAG: long-chain fatty acid--CoA ligase, partial [Bacteroidetes bacterium]
MNPTRTFDLLDRYLQKFPGRHVLAEKINGRWIYYTSEQYYETAHRFALGLLSLGFRRGDRIMTVTNNRPGWNFVDMGIALAGMVHVPVYTSLNGGEYRHILEHSGSRMVIVSDHKLYGLIEPVVATFSAVEHFLTFDEISGARNWTEILDAGEKAGNDIRNELASIKSSITSSDMAALIYTS